ncbi:TetR/AcrR family transcriptional regulator [Yinghuangia sp. YIM S09857]|uniref:TetR/AcrR family transcriptional regulator n=1 Tax=Yinghuangia sp. YIM S09857 TaxID=3436929 RepID=UPI003F5323CB
MPDVPEVPTPAWRTARKPARAPRRPPVTAEAIVDAALDIVDTEGLEALSMRGVAQRLGTGAATLYAHVQNKEELVELVLDRVNGEVRLPEPDPDRWREQLRESARQIRDVYAAHNDLAKAGFGKVPTLPNSLTAIEGMLTLLKAGDLPDKVASWAADLLALYTTSAAFEQGLLRLEEKRNPGATAEYFRQLGEFFHALPPERFPTLTGMLASMVEGDNDERFDFGVDVITLGLRAYADRMRAEEGTE